MVCFRNISGDILHKGDTEDDDDDDDDNNNKFITFIAVFDNSKWPRGSRR
jgi:hypothetical protein